MEALVGEGLGTGYQSMGRTTTPNPTSHHAIPLSEGFVLILQ